MVQLKSFAFTILAACVAIGLTSTAQAIPNYSVIDLGVLSGDTVSFASDINDNGIVVGVSRDSSFKQHGFFFDTNNPGAGMQAIGTLGGTRSFANGVNNNGVIVGLSTLAGASGVKI